MSVSNCSSFSLPFQTTPSSAIKCNNHSWNYANVTLKNDRTVLRLIDSHGTLLDFNGLDHWHGTSSLHGTIHRLKLRSHQAKFLGFKLRLHRLQKTNYQKNRWFSDFISISHTSFQFFPSLTPASTHNTLLQVQGAAAGYNFSHFICTSMSSTGTRFNSAVLHDVKSVPWRLVVPCKWSIPWHRFQQRSHSFRTCLRSPWRRFLQRSHSCRTCRHSHWRKFLRRSRSWRRTCRYPWPWLLL